MSDPTEHITTYIRRSNKAHQSTFKSIGAFDHYQAHARFLADAVGITIGDRDQALTLAAGLLVAHGINAEMHRDKPAAWTADELTIAAVPLSLTAGLLLPYVEGTPR